MDTPLKPIGTCVFSEPLSGEECIVIVSAVPGAVRVALSRREDGDIEVSIPLSEVQRIREALDQAFRQATNWS